MRFVKLQLIWQRVLLERAAETFSPQHHQTTTTVRSFYSVPFLTGTSLAISTLALLWGIEFMGNTTKIQWCDFTFNPWEGCTKVSPGCANCYAEARNSRFGGGTAPNWGKGKPRRRTSVDNWKMPLKWNKSPWICDECGWAYKDNAGACEVKQCKIYLPDFHGEKHCDCMNFHRARVFCASLADWLDDEVPIEWLADLLKLIHDTPNLDWLLLTKRPEKWRRRLEAVADLENSSGRSTDFFDWLDGWLEDWPERLSPPDNVWIGASVENQPMADKRIPELLKIPAKVRFLSVEPMLGEIRFPVNAFRTVRDGCVVNYSGVPIKWAIFGGESGKGARPCNMQWIYDGVKQCQDAGVKAFVKQLGSVAIHTDRRFSGTSERLKIIPYADGLNQLCFADKKGGDMAEWPVDLRIREFPV